tara:strand:+ start:985 stop:1323 length:339 start_codon:yes stop_codon:yes gene_type:complete
MAMAAGAVLGALGFGGPLDAAFAFVVILNVVAALGTECTKAGGAASASTQLVIWLWIASAWWGGRNAGWWLGGWSGAKPSTMPQADEAVQTALCLMVGMVFALVVVAVALAA